MSVTMLARMHVTCARVRMLPGRSHAREKGALESGCSRVSSRRGAELMRDACMRVTMSRACACMYMCVRMLPRAHARAHVCEDAPRGCAPRWHARVGFARQDALVSGPGAEVSSCA
jgi:hypothetical protein|eukprot:Tamp_28613.p1 GENE.Tamp_28613~~Tamp_28613.p1  ORF type:complete len:116 (-),score=11.58 Tamp_28613:297-644(-)